MIHFFKGLADETRLKIVAILSMGEFSVQEITRVLGMGQSRISRHLKILNDAGIADYRRDGARVFYRLSSDLKGHPALISNLTIEWCKEQSDWRVLCSCVEEVLEWRRSQSRSFFSQVGQDWSALLTRFLDQDVFLEEVRKSVSGIRNLADLGCGPGVVMRELSSHIPFIIGVDYSTKMLEHARENLRDLLTQGSVDLRLGAIEHLPMRDGEVDGVLINLVLHHLAEPYSIFKEVYRVLSPGGRIIIVDFNKHEKEEFRDDMADFWLGFEARDLNNWLKEAGFTDVRIGPIPGGKNTVELIVAVGIR
ncbi:metalloregulator ArsR/SmtB family transcription factor [bacterium]|nr:metalloregulator ArsR/SmtB family transcription factor [candidate division CSSED10-310 bacterium]